MSSVVRSNRTITIDLFEISEEEEESMMKAISDYIFGLGDKEFNVLMVQSPMDEDW